MTLYVRRALALFFICLFAFVAPAALAYARGYRFNISTWSLRQTGVIFIQGDPKETTLSLDGQFLRPATLPKTFRSIVPGSHLVSIGASGYAPQQFTVHTFPGQTSYLTNIQLIHTLPWQIIQTGIPDTAQLAPNGSALAWIAEGRVHISTAEETIQSPVIDNLQSISWVSDHIEVFDSKKTFVGTISQRGEFQVSKTPTNITNTELETLAKKANLNFDHAQRVPELRAWLVTNSEGAWFLEDNGSTSLVSRWVDSPLATKMLSRSILAIVRHDGVTLRNVVNGHIESFRQPNITAIASEPTKGDLDVLVKDGDLRTWMRADFF